MLKDAAVRHLGEKRPRPEKSGSERTKTAYFSFLQGSLNLTFLHVQPLLHFLQLVNGFCSLADLIWQVSDLLWGSSRLLVNIWWKVNVKPIIRSNRSSWQGIWGVSYDDRYLGGSCSPSWGSPDDPEPPRRSSSAWRGRCSGHETLSERSPALTGTPHTSVSTPPAPGGDEANSSHESALQLKTGSQICNHSLKAIICTRCHLLIPCQSCVASCRGQRLRHWRVPGQWPGPRSLSGVDV